MLSHPNGLSGLYALLLSIFDCFLTVSIPVITYYKVYETHVILYILYILITQYNLYSLILYRNLYKLHSDELKGPFCSSLPINKLQPPTP